MTTGPLVLVGPSGAGKTTIARRLVERCPDRFFLSISATTRRPRPGEVDGVDYHFISPDRFRALIEEGALAEWAEVHGELYGTPVRSLERLDSAAPIPILDIDVQGARQVLDRLPRAWTVFVIPPGPGVWIERLRRRGTESGEELRRRLDTAIRELETVPLFANRLINRDLEESADRVLSVLSGSRLSTAAAEVDILIGALEDGARAEVARLAPQPPLSRDTGTGSAANDVQERERETP